MKLPCGHDIGEEDFVSQLDEQLLGLPTCHDCATVVPYSHRYRAKLAERRKLALAETADLFFASKIGLQAKKKRLAEDVRGNIITIPLVMRLSLLSFQAALTTTCVNSSSLDWRIRPLLSPRWRS